MPDTDWALGAISSACLLPGPGTVGGFHVLERRWADQTHTPHLRTGCTRVSSLVRLGSAAEQSCWTGLLPGCCRQGLVLLRSWVWVVAGPSPFPPSRPIPSGWALQHLIQAWWDNTGVVALTKQVTLQGGGWGSPECRPGACSLVELCWPGGRGQCGPWAAAHTQHCNICLSLWSCWGCLSLTLCCRMLPVVPWLVAVLVRQSSQEWPAVPPLGDTAEFNFEMCNFYKNVRSTIPNN